MEEVAKTIVVVEPAAHLCYKHFEQLSIHAKKATLCILVADPIPYLGSTHYYFCFAKDSIVVQQPFLRHLYHNADTVA
jgi:hypothetical protein